MIKINGILKIKNNEIPIEYRVLETDQKILRVTDTQTQSWYDLRPLLEDTEAFAKISASADFKENLSNRHGYGIIATHGVFSYEDCDFLVTDAFGGKTLMTFLHTASIENRSLSPLNILSFLEDLTNCILQWKIFHGYINYNTVLLDCTVSHDSYRSGLICFPDRFPIQELENYADYFQPSVYLKKLGNQQLIADDSYALALILLQFLSLHVGVSEPMLSNEVISQFNHFIKDKPISRFFQTKILPYINKLLNGAITLEEVKSFVNTTNLELESAQQLGESLHKYLQNTKFVEPQLTRSNYYLQFRCPYCQSIILHPKQSNGTGICSVCFQNITFPRTPEAKVCRSCKHEFPVSSEYCDHCSPFADTTTEKSDKISVYEPVEIFGGSEEMVNPLTTLPGFEGSIDDLTDTFERSSGSSFQSSKTSSSGKADKKGFTVIDDSTEESNPNLLANSAISSALTSTNITALHSNGKLTIEVLKANPGRWKFEVLAEEKGDLIVDGEYVCTEYKNFKYVIPLNDDDLNTYIFVNIYLDNQSIACKRVVTDIKNKKLLGKIWKKS